MLDLAASQMYGRVMRGQARWRRASGGIAAFAVATTVGASAVMMVGPGCTTETIDGCDPKIWAPKPPPAFACGPFDAGDSADASDAEADGPPPKPTCDGECIVRAPNGWDPPSLVWIGPESDAPPCPEAALRVGFEGHAGLSAPHVCGACACAPPSGSCEMPTTITASSTPCPGTDPGAVQTPFDPPPGWSGACTDHDALSMGKLCDGVPCVQSVTIGPLTVNETGCAPTQVASSFVPPPTWSTFVRSCIGEPPGRCEKSLHVCVPPTATGFHQCIFQKGDNDCSSSELMPYTEKHVFYKSLEDTRACSACACGAPFGGACSANISFYDDGTCSTVASTSKYVDSSGALCIDQIPGTALGSKSAREVRYTPGTCFPSGGDPVGSIQPSNAATFCCIPIL